MKLVIAACALLLAQAMPAKPQTAAAESKGFTYGPAFAGLQLAIVVNPATTGTVPSRLSVPVTLSLRNAGGKTIGLSSAHAFLDVQPMVKDVAGKVVSEASPRCVVRRESVNSGAVEPPFPPGATLQINEDLACWADVKIGSTYSVRYFDRIANVGTVASNLVTFTVAAPSNYHGY